MPRLPRIYLKDSVADGYLLEAAVGKLSTRFWRWHDGVIAELQYEGGAGVGFWVRDRPGTALDRMICAGARFDLIPPRVLVGLSDSYDVYYSNYD